MSVATQTRTLATPRADDARLLASRRFCESLTRAAAKNFYYGLRLLPEPKRSAMYAIYAYMRLVDDIADKDDGRTVAQRITDLETWRRQTHDAMPGANEDAPPPTPAAVPPDLSAQNVWPAFSEVAKRFELPVRIFDDVIAGQQQDLQPAPFETFDQLQQYCYRVAGVVGLASIYIWGFAGGEETERLAIARGVAFQLTNILRDLKEDGARGRVYLPLEDLQALNVSSDDLRAGRVADESFLELMRFEIARAESFYEQSRELERRIQPDSRPTLIAMTEIYHGLLKKVSADPARVLRERVSLSLLSKLRIGWRASRAK